jgi:phosphonate transport system substrate-binding protein
MNGIERSTRHWRRQPLKRMMRLIQVCHCLIFSTILGGASLTSLSAHAADAYRFGVFPFLPPTRLEKVFSPIAAEMEKTLGVPVEFRTSSTFEKFAANVADQQYDFAFVQPFLYIRAADKYHYLPLAALDETLKAIFVVGNNSPLHGLEELKGMRIALPPPSAAVDHLVKNHLKGMGLYDSIKFSYQRSHFSCLQQVLIGEADACGTAEAALNFFESKMKLKMKIIGETAGIPHSLFIAHSRVPERDREAIRAFLLTLHKSKVDISQQVPSHFRSFKTAKDSDYDPVREIAKKL